MTDADGHDLGQYSVDELVHLTQRDYRRYCAKEGTDDRFAFELFRRAIVLHNEDSWQAIVEVYSPLVSTWIRNCEKARWLLDQDTVALPVLMNACFLKFFLALQPAKFACFSSSSALLAYLRRCVHSVVCDEFGKFQRWRSQDALFETSALSLPYLRDPADMVEITQTTQNLWQVVAGMLQSQHERVVIVCLYLWGMKPCAISTAYPELFPTVVDVYRVKRNVLLRLRHNRRLQAKLQAVLVS